MHMFSLDQLRFAALERFVREFINRRVFLSSHEVGLELVVGSLEARLHSSAPEHTNVNKQKDGACAKILAYAHNGPRVGGVHPGVLGVVSHREVAEGCSRSNFEWTIRNVVGRQILDFALDVPPFLILLHAQHQARVTG